MKLDEKTQIVEELKEKFTRSAVVILTDYKGLNVTQMTELRRQLRDADIEYRVVKNTLLARASEGTEVAVIRDRFSGPTAVALSYTDPIAPARVLAKFAKGNDKLKIKAGALRGKALDPKAVLALSELPSREQLLAQLLSVLIGVPTALVRALNNVPGRMVTVLQAIKEKKEAA